MKKNHATGRRHRHRNPEGEGQHHAAHKPGWVMPVVVIGGILFLMKSNAFAGILGPGVGGSGYTPIGTDANGRPIYAGAPGSTAPVGYTRTGTTPQGQPIYESSGSSVLGPLGTIVGAGGGLVNIIGRIFGGGSSVSSTPAPTLPGGGTSVTYPDILTGVGSGGGFTLPDISLPDFGTWLPDISLPDLTLGDMWGGGGGGFDFGVPELTLDLSPISDTVAAVVPDFSNVWGEF